MIPFYLCFWFISYIYSFVVRFYGHTCSIQKFLGWGSIWNCNWGYATGMATLDLSRFCDLRYRLWQCWIHNPLSEVRDRTHIFTEKMWVLNLLSHNGNSSYTCISFLVFFFCFLGPHSRHMEVPRLGIESELPAYTTATAMLDPQPTERGWGSNLFPHGYQSDSFLLL